MHSYVAHTLKDVYDINNLDLALVCKSFGLSHPPFVSLNLKITSSSSRRKKNFEKGDKQEFYSKGYGNDKDDKRQFSY